MQNIYYQPVQFQEEKQALASLFLFSDYLAYKKQSEFHWHAAVEVIYCINNSLLLHMQGDTVQIAANDFAYFNSGDVHAAEVVQKSTASSGILLLLSDHMFSSIRPDFHQCRIEIPIGHPGRKEIIATLHRIYNCKRNPSLNDQALINAELWRLVYLMLVFLQPKEKMQATVYDQKEQLAKQAISYIEQHFKEPLTLGQVASAVGLQENYFCRYFKKYTGVSFGQYLSQLRLHYALSYMLDFGGSVVESALQAGFPSAQSFTVCCRSTYGFTPTQYKREHHCDCGN